MIDQDRRERERERERIKKLNSFRGERDKGLREKTRGVRTEEFALCREDGLCQKTVFGERENEGK
jgi:hypothetical protein